MSDESGFTLIEVLVALVILGLSVGGVLAAIANGLSLAHRGKGELAASALAQSLLDRVGRDLPLEDGERSGLAEDGLNWRLTVAPYGAPRDREAWPLAAKSVTVAVGAVRLTTLRLAAREQAQ